MKIFYFIIFSILLTNYAFSDDWDFRECVPEQMIVESENYKVVHNYNFNPYDEFAYIECISKNTNEILFHIHSSYLTDIFISDDEKYIIGITSWYLDNPYQLIILTINGEILYTRLISFFEYKLNHDELLEFIEHFPEQYRLLESMGKITNIEPFYYIDYFFLYRDGDLFQYRTQSYLEKYKIKNRLSNNIMGTATLWIWWFKHNMDLQYIYENNELIGISLLDPRDERMFIYINKE
jgi:hypothetical protein